MLNKNNIDEPQGIYEITETEPSKNSHRLHRKLKFWCDLEVGFNCTWEYCDANGVASDDLKYGMCRTSIVKTIMVDEKLDVIIIETMNSTYKFERVT